MARIVFNPDKTQCVIDELPGGFQSEIIDVDEADIIETEEGDYAIRDEGSGYLVYRVTYTPIDTQHAEVPDLDEFIGDDDDDDDDEGDGVEIDHEPVEVA